MSKSFFSTDPVSHKGATNVWLTPKWLLDELGEFDLDPCAAPNPRPFPTAKKMITEADECGLKASWHGRVWLNPPYGKQIGPWLEKLKSHGDGIALVFARTETN
ncbi:MAG TPA: DNA N-6-adenine-methyltransferase, partial [Anaerovoracaceae bacterium]|nr:DNA N-6-adenine-methyltransferase [Anaerovoracaceae bacterium]